jgi:Tol biopolymer transport system component
VGLGDRAFGNFALSPDGQRLAVEVDEPRPDIWILDVPRGALSRLTTDGVSRNPVWTTDGARVTFYAARPGTPGLYWQPWDGSAPPERLLDLHGRISGSWSPDGRSFMYSRVAADGNFDLWTLRVDGHSRTTSPFLESPFTEWGGAWSPNGRWVAYTSDESGRYEVYVRSARGEGRKWQVSSDGGEEPRWSAAGRELVFRNGQRWLAAPVSSDGPEFGAEQARVLFEGPYINTPGPSYDVSPAGRFVVLAPAGDEPGTRQVHVVVNWFEELKTKR